MLKVVVLLSVPSLTVRVMVTGPPFWFAAGVTVTVRLAPLPPNMILALGMIVVELELPVTVNDATGSSKSPTVNDKAPVATSSFIL